MSIICITHHDESIYESTKPPISYHKKSPRYISKYREYIKREREERKLRDIKEHESMGLPHTTLPDPKDFLKKNSWKPPIKPSLVLEKGKTATVRIMPDVPKKDEVLKEQDEKLKHVKKNFVCLNVRRAITMKPKEPERRVVLEKHGESKPLERGLEPKYIFSDVFGKTPEYLNHFIKIREKMIQRKKDKVGLQQPVCKYITRDQREQLLEGLKQNWEELQKQYQGLPIMTDTIPKILRKSKLEADLKQLEKDIVLVERHPYIYVYDDNSLPTK